MSAKLMGAVFDLQLDRDEFPVMIALADHAHDDGTSIYPSIGYLAWKTNLSERSVQRILRKLEERELVEVIDRHSGGRSITREYRIHIEKGVKKSPYIGKKGARTSPIEKKRVTPVTEKGDTGDVEKGDTHVTPLKRTVSIEPSEEPSVLARADAPRKGRQDILWDTQVEIFGFKPTDKTPEHGKWNRAVGIWRALKATPDDMRRAAALYAERYPTMDFNALAVANNAEKLLRGRQPPPSVNSIKNPIIRSALTTDLSDIREEYEAKRAKRTAIQGQDDRPGELFGTPRRLAAGE